MAYIRYIEHFYKYNNVYANLINGKLRILQNHFNHQLDKYDETAKILIKFNDNTELEITEEKIASAAMQSIDKPEVYQDLNTIYSLIGKPINKINAKLSELGSNQPGNLMYQLQNSLIPSGRYAVQTKNMDILSQIPNFLVDTANSLKQDIYGPIGQLGEMTSTLAATSLTNELIKEIEDQVGTVQGVSISRVNVGTQQQAGYHMQTDNRFNINFTLKNGQKATAEINISDKASKNQLLNFERKRSTGQIYLSRSNPAELSKSLSGIENGPYAIDPLIYYNTISYHKRGQSRWTHMWSGSAAGQALKNYYGYKLLARTFITSQQFETVHFTVMGNKIIPETQILNQVQALKRGGRSNKYQATIENYKLIKGGKGISASSAKSAVKNEEEAQSVIDNMGVAIKTSFVF